MKAGMYDMLKNIIEAVYVSYGESKPKIELYDDDTVEIIPRANIDNEKAKERYYTGHC